MKEAWIDGARKRKEIGGYAEIDDATLHMIEVLGEGDDHECRFDRFFENLFHTHRPSEQTALPKNPPSGNDFVGALSWGGLGNELNPKFRLRTLHDVVVDEEGIWLIAKPLRRPPFRADGTPTPLDVVDVLDRQPSKDARRRLLEAVGFVATAYAVLYASGKIDRRRFAENVARIDVPDAVRRIEANPAFRAYLADQASRNEWGCSFDAVSRWLADDEHARQIAWPVDAFRVQFEPWTSEERDAMAAAVMAPPSRSADERPDDDDAGGDESGDGSG